MNVSSDMTDELQVNGCRELRRSPIATVSRGDGRKSHHNQGNEFFYAGLAIPKRFYRDRQLRRTPDLRSGMGLVITLPGYPVRAK